SNSYDRHPAMTFDCGGTRHNQENPADDFQNSHVADGLFFWLPSNRSKCFLSLRPSSRTFGSWKIELWSPGTSSTASLSGHTGLHPNSGSSTPCDGGLNKRTGNVTCGHV